MEKQSGKKHGLSHTRIMLQNVVPRASILKGTCNEEEGFAIYINDNVLLHYSLLKYKILGNMLFFQTTKKNSQ